jgi:hypothetical protein
LSTPQQKPEQAVAAQEGRGRYRAWQKGRYIYLEPGSFLVIRLLSYVFMFIALSFFQEATRGAEMDGLNMVFYALVPALILLGIPLFRIRVEPGVSIALGRGWTIPFVWNVFAKKRAVDLAQAQSVGVVEKDNLVTIRLQEGAGEDLRLGAGATPDQARALASQIAEITGLSLV